MRILNFIPLLIWCLGFLVIVAWDDHRRLALGIKCTDDEAAIQGIVYILGCIMWLMIGIWA